MRRKSNIPEEKYEGDFVFECNDEDENSWDTEDENEEINEEFDRILGEDGKVIDDHEMKIILNRLSKVSEAAKIPFFAAFYAASEQKYEYRAVLPEEIGVRKEYGKFDRFMRVCLDFNKEEHMEVIKTS